MDGNTYSNVTNSTANGTESDEGGFGNVYDPTAPVPYWHQNMELIFICVCNGLSVLIVALRTFIKFRRSRKVKADDFWLFAATFFLILPLWVCQVGTNRYGDGLHSDNVPVDWDETYFDYSFGLVAYHVVVSFIKIAVLTCFLQIIPPRAKMLKWFITGLAIFTFVFGFLIVFLLLFACTPFKSNFNYNIDPTSCINTDIVKYVWSAISITIDVLICWLPFQILADTKMDPATKRILIFMFMCTFLGTVACGVSIYGEWLSRADAATADFFWTGTPWVVCNVTEILAYNLGAFLPVLSPYIISSRKKLLAKGTLTGGTRLGRIRKAFGPETQGATVNATLRSEVPLRGEVEDEKGVEHTFA